MLLLLLAWLSWPALAPPPRAQQPAVQVTLPSADGSVKFMIMGDSGSGSPRQYELAARMAEARARFPFDFALMLGDNIYGRETAREYAEKFERPYEPLLDAGVQFYATLGNHDTPNQRFYRLFNMNGQRYYTFTRGPVQFFVLDSTYVDRAQVEWLARELARSGARWKIAYAHHPLYSSGRRHGPDLGLRALAEPIFVRHGVDAVFAGHEHFYERIHPQRGIHYFTSGAAGKLRRGDIRRGPQTAAGFDQDFSFMLVEIDGDRLHFQVIARTGATVDQGVIERPPDPQPAETGAR